MQILGLNLPPSAINLPLSISFPLHKLPSLDVTVWGRGVPDANQGLVLAIKAVNLTGVPVEVTDVNVSFIYNSFLAEILFGSKTVRLPLHKLAGKQRLPCVLQVGESALWTANLRQLADELENRSLMLNSHSRYLNARRINVERWREYRRLAIIARNWIAIWSSRGSAVVVCDGRGVLHKAKIREQPPLWAVLRRRRVPNATTEDEIFENLIATYL